MPNENDREEKIRRLINEHGEEIEKFITKLAEERPPARDKLGYPITQQQWDRALRLIEDWLNELTGQRPPASKSAIRVEVDEARTILRENEREWERFGSR